MVLDAPVDIAYFDWATNSGAAGSDPVRWVIKASNDGVDWVTKGGAINKGFYENELFAPSAARGAWQGPFSACGGKPTQDYFCEDFDHATGVSSPQTATSQDPPDTVNRKVCRSD